NLRNSLVRWACLRTGNTEKGSALGSGHRNVTMSPESQRRNGVAVWLHSGVITSAPGSPSATGLPVTSSTTSTRKRSAHNRIPSMPSRSDAIIEPSVMPKVSSTGAPHAPSSLARVAVESCSAEQAMPEVFGGARIEGRAPGRAARAPELDGGARWLNAERRIERVGIEGSQLVLRQRRDLPPLVGIVEPVDVDTGHARGQERRAP